MLGALPPARVIAAAQDLAGPFKIEPLQLRSAGLALLPLREGCFGEVFNLCEVPLAEAAIELVDASGRYSGGARVTASDAAYAEAVAVLDAIMAHDLAGADRARALLMEGLALVQAEHARRSELVARTRVDFEALAFTGDDDDNP